MRRLSLILVFCMMLSIIPSPEVFANDNKSDVFNGERSGLIYRNLDLMDRSNEEVNISNVKFEVNNSKMNMMGELLYKNRKRTLTIEGQIYKSPMSIYDNNRVIIEAKSRSKDFKILHMSVEKNAIEKLLTENKGLKGKTVLRLAVLTKNDDIIYIETELEDEQLIKRFFENIDRKKVKHDEYLKLLKLETWFSDYNKNSINRHGECSGKILESQENTIWVPKDEVDFPDFLPLKYLKKECEESYYGSKYGYYVNTIPYMNSNDVYLSSVMAYIFNINLFSGSEVKEQLQVKFNKLIMYSKDHDMFMEAGDYGSIELRDVHLCLSAGKDLVKNYYFDGEALDEEWFSWGKIIKGVAAAVPYASSVLYSVEELLAGNDLDTNYVGLSEGSNTKEVVYGDYETQENYFGKLYKAAVGILDEDYSLYKESSLLRMHAGIGYNESIDKDEDNSGFYLGSYQFEVYCDGSKADEGSNQKKYTFKRDAYQY